VGKCCSNVLRSLRAYVVPRKAVRTHVCVKRTIQRTCVARDVRSHTYNRERGHIHPCIRACRHTKYKHACMPCTYTYFHSSAQPNSIYHALIRAGYVLHSL
jgi:IS5 family transposase